MGQKIFGEILVGDSWDYRVGEANRGNIKIITTSTTTIANVGSFPRGHFGFERTLYATGSFKIKKIILNTEIDDARKAKEKAAVEVALDRKKKSEERGQLKVEKKRVGREFWASKDLERVSSTVTVLQYRDSAIGTDETSWEVDESLLNDLFWFSDCGTNT